MKDEKFTQYNSVLEHIANEISISKSMQDKAIESYEAVGKWIGDGIDDVLITPQGSMSLGTTIKPISDKDDYDIDLVAMIKNGQSLSAEQIKHTIGDRLKENEIYRKKIQDEGEGKRCWKMQYDNFHMDILPCVPKDIYIEPHFTAIRLTHKQSDHKYKDHYSNPYGYRRWFESRMQPVLDDRKKLYAYENRMNIEDVPTFRVKTPLQCAIQIIKRHRDILFKDDPDNAPISIIITTLSAKAYNGENTTYEALYTILSNMEQYIEVRNGVYWVQNPVIEEENFADKWETHPERKDAFFYWLIQAKKDLLITPLASSGLNQIGDNLGRCLGENVVARGMNKYAEEVRAHRENKTLFSTTTGLTTTNKGKPVKGHTFFGK